MSDLPVVGRWFGPPQRPLLGWWHPAAGSGSAAGSRPAAVLLPPLGYGAWTAHRTLRTLAEQLAEHGTTALRVDYDGTGDSSGTLLDADRWAALLSTARYAVQELRHAGVDQVHLIGLGLGGTVALSVAAELDVAGVLAWDPVVQGRRWRRELTLLGVPIPGVGSASAGGASAGGANVGALAHAGTVFTAQTVADIGALDLRRLTQAPAARVLVLSRPERPQDDLVEHLQSLGSQVTHEVQPGTELALDVPTEDAVVPTALLAVLVEWATAGAAPSDPVALAGSTDPEASADFPGRSEAVLEWQDGQVRECVQTFGQRRLVGVLGRPTGPDDDGFGSGHPLVVFVNSGSEHHIGPGRAWVEYCRFLNGHGYSTLRLDFSGWGESPDHGRAPGRPYDPNGVHDLVDVVADLRAQGWPGVVLVGVCAGAWISLDAARQVPLDGVLALNPQLYWSQGDPVVALLSEARVARTAEREHQERMARWHLWSALDAVGVRHPVARWFSALRRRRVPVLMLFAEGDDGIEFLQTRLSRSLRREQRHGLIRTAQLPGLDHAMHRTWLRDQVTEALLVFLRALPDYGRRA